MGKKSRSRSRLNIPDHISESLETILWDKILKFFFGADPGTFLTPDQGSGMEKIRIQDKHSRSAPLYFTPPPPPPICENISWADHSYLAVGGTAFALEPAAVHADVPVGEVVDKLDKAGNDGVEAVGGHLLGYELEQGLREGQDPPVHDVRGLSVTRLQRAESELYCLGDLRTTKKEEKMLKQDRGI
jgi:hypothetical protein